MEKVRKVAPFLLATLVLALLTLALGHPALAAQNTVPVPQSNTSYSPALSPDMPGIFALTREAGFLYMTGALPSTWGDAEWQWRTGNGAAARWWLDVEGGNLFLFSKAEPRWDAGEETSATNFLALSVPLKSFQEWFWCGTPIYDRYHRFVGSGCNPNFGPPPSGKGQLADWMNAAIEESQPHVWRVLGAYCVVDRTAHIEIQPACPTEGQAVRVVVSGNWGNGCPEVNATLLTEEGRFRIEGTLQSPPDVVCPAVITAWSFSYELGTLKAGSYDVAVTMLDRVAGAYTFNDLLTFDVAPAPPPPTD